MKIAMLLAVSSLLPAGPLAAQTAGTTPAAAGAVFEMRTYYTEPGRLSALNARFRDHTNALFVKHGMEIVGFWEPVDAEAGAGAKLVYILRHRSREAAQASWNAFRADPEWQRVRAESEKDGKIVAKLESVFLTATDYSPVR